MWTNGWESIWRYNQQPCDGDVGSTLAPSPGLNDTTRQKGTGKPYCPLTLHTRTHTHLLTTRLFSSLICWSIYGPMKVYPLGKRGVYKMWNLNNLFAEPHSSPGPIWPLFFQLQYLVSRAFIIILLFLLNSKNSSMWYLLGPCGRRKSLAWSSIYCVWGWVFSFVFCFCFFLLCGGSFYFLALVIFGKLTCLMFQLLRTSGEAKHSFN